MVFKFFVILATGGVWSVLGRAPPALALVGWGGGKLSVETLSLAPALGGKPICLLNTKNKIAIFQYFCNFNIFYYRNIDILHP